MTEDQRRRNRKQLYRRKRRRRRIKLLLCFLVLAIPTVTVGILIKNQFGDQIRLVGMGMTNEKVRQVMSRSEQYPDELLELLADNEETVDFVLDYPEKKDAAPAETVGDVVKGQIPLLLQWDERWGYTEYAGELMGLSGCGPTCLSMACIYFFQDATYTPKYVAEFSEEHGYAVDGNGSAWTLIPQGGKELGLDVVEIPLDENRIINNLEVGNLIICVVGPGDFTTSGHFLVLTGYEDGYVKLNDPNSPMRTEQKWELTRVMEQIDNLWVCRLPSE